MPEARKKEWSFDFEGDDHEDLTGTPMMATTITTDDGESPDWSFDFE